MIVGSLLLILVAVTLLVLGLVNGSSGLLISSIATSLLAAVALVVGARQAAAARAGADHGNDDPGMRAGGVGEGRSWSRRWSSDGAVGERDRRPMGSGIDVAGTVDAGSVDFSVPTQGSRVGSGPDEDSVWRPPDDPVQAWADPAGSADDPDDVADPADEPARQRVSATDAARVAQLDTEVLVVDGRPRYHLPQCAHLCDRESEPLPVREAVELGFSPCADCAPDTALLADGYRV